MKIKLKHLLMGYCENLLLKKIPNFVFSISLFMLITVVFEKKSFETCSILRFIPLFSHANYVVYLDEETTHRFNLLVNRLTLLNQIRTFEMSYRLSNESFSCVPFLTFISTFMSHVTIYYPLTMQRLSQKVR